ncbi:hypothetical protein A2U01_0111692, partial [Trifolium medium]|nr:hypothetical protein [Trifolium medium]
AAATEAAAAVETSVAAVLDRELP